jgi:hypothetical protein
MSKFYKAIGRIFLLLFCLLPLCSTLADNKDPLKFVWQKSNLRGATESYGVEFDEKGAGKFHFKQKDQDLVEVSLVLKPSTVDSLLSLFQQSDFLNEGKGFVSGRKVADMGMKMIRFESGSKRREVTFNYTEDKTLQQIVNFFENLCQQERSLFEMDLALKYDRLGIPKKLDELERNLSAKRIVAPERFAPILERIYQDESLINYSRAEAKKILSKIDKMQPFQE